MKLKAFALVSVCLLVITAISCSNTSSRSRKPVARIDIRFPKGKPVYGDSIRVQIKVDPKNGELQNAELYLDNELLTKSTSENFNYQVKSISSLGKHQFKVIATKTDGVEGVSYKNFEVFSRVKPQLLRYEIVHTYPHNTDHFTQGLEVHNNKFYESTGQNGQSGIYRFDLQSGKILQEFKMEEKYFGEGITIVGDKIYQLTYKAQKGFVYDLNSFARVDSFLYDTAEGWGLTHDGEYLIKTDGSEFLDFINPKTFQVERRVAVYDNNGLVRNLNELEYYNGYVYSNIWQTNYAVKIDPRTGEIAAKIDFSGLMSVMYNPEKPIDVLNGIAFNKSNGKMYVTGKLWPSLFEVKLVETN
ncbi:glutaminyl-peptide cyclotransferase [Mangrovibacterium marinum]|uniref:Glutamine cyclotransferase n=1 Tax=Mangrovibacterium marinum TaxID=1639118 RepID=A0A2T5C2I9_9BACT|nr:glutaminyl-peptide cyclotransferase [Mangrovibacterium marinum]PTN08918.1 glutamine cyclotransferase [Mangrovibacterium marinum]